MTIQQLMQKAFLELKQKEVENPINKMRILLATTLNKPKEYGIMHPEETITIQQEQQFLDKIQQLKQGTPLQYITNYQEFMGLSFYVDENVLIPQPDTEILIEEVEKKILKEKSMEILDLGTGSGAIAISLAKRNSNLNVTGTDISNKALEIARKNAILNQVTIQWIQSDLFQNIKNKKWDIIISNPPYIKTKVIPKLEIEVQKEPMLALDGGEDGLKFYREISKQAPQFLKQNGYLALEIGYDQKAEVKNILKNSTAYQNIEEKKDLGGKDRVILAQKI